MKPDRTQVGQPRRAPDGWYSGLEAYREREEAHRKRLAAAEARDKAPGRRRSLTADQVHLARELQDYGASGRRITQLLQRGGGRYSTRWEES